MLIRNKTQQKCTVKLHVGLKTSPTPPHSITRQTSRLLRRKTFRCSRELLNNKYTFDRIVSIKPSARCSINSTRLTIANNFLLTEGKDSTGKSQTDTLPRFEIFRLRPNVRGY